MPLLSKCITAAIEDAGTDVIQQEKIKRMLNNMFDFFNKYLVYDANSNEHYRNQNGTVDFAKDMRSKGKPMFDLGKVEMNGDL